MSLTDAAILGIIQGLTEFLPISSSGHLVVSQKLLGVAQHDLDFDIAAHVGTLLSIITVYIHLLKKLCVTGLPRVFDKKNKEAHVIRMVLLGSVPTALIGLTFKSQFEALFSNMWAVGIGFIWTGFVLLSTRAKKAQFSGEDLSSLQGVENLNWKNALIVGAAQGLAIAPAVSRAGMTIAAGLWAGLPGQTAAMFSFMLSLPAVAGAAALELRDVSISPDRLSVLAVGLVMAYLAGLAGLWGVLTSIRKGRLEIFTLYLVALGGYILFSWT